MVYDKDPLTVEIYRRLLTGNDIQELKQHRPSFKKSLRLVHRYIETEELNINDIERARMTGLSWRICHNLSIVRRALKVGCMR